jgi:hypothetical protein
LLCSFFIVALHSQIFNSTAKINNIEDRFNSWQRQKPMIHIEDLTSSNYQNHEFESFVKQITTRETSGMAMRKEVEMSNELQFLVVILIILHCMV